MKRLTIPMLALAACSQQTQPNAVANEPESNLPDPNGMTAEAPLRPPTPGEPGGLPDESAPISEGPINANSAQGAGQVLQRYFALLESGKTTEAYGLWSGSGTPQDFAAQLARYREVHGNIGAPGEPEGAAGSIYVEIPVQLYGRLNNGKEFNSRGTMILRRVNDVPGSTDEERRWHLYKANFPA